MAQGFSIPQRKVVLRRLWCWLNVGKFSGVILNKQEETLKTQLKCESKHEQIISWCRAIVSLFSGFDNVQFDSGEVVLYYCDLWSEKGRSELWRGQLSLSTGLTRSDPPPESPVNLPPGQGLALWSIWFNSHYVRSNTHGWNLETAIRRTTPGQCAGPLQRTDAFTCQKDARTAAPRRHRCFPITASLIRCELYAQRQITTNYAFTHLRCHNTGKLYQTVRGWKSINTHT